MTDTSLPASRFAERDFRVGNAMNQAIQVLSRNVVPFSIVTGVAALPSVLLFGRDPGAIKTATEAAWYVAGFLIMIMLGAVSQAVVLYGAFEDMRGRPVNLVASLKVGWRRFLPVIGTAIAVGLLGALGCVLLLVPGFILFTMWYVATPAVVVEPIGPWRAMSRSAELTKGNRWKVFGMMVLLIIIGAIGGGMVAGVSAATGTTIGLLLNLVWSALFGAFSAILVVVTYHDLRVVKEGVDIDQIAAVFD
jgi:MFS family permease